MEAKHQAQSSSDEDSESGSQSKMYMENMRNQYDMLLQQVEHMKIKLRKFKDLQKDASMWSDQIQNSDNVDINRYKECETGTVTTSDFQINLSPYQDDASLEVFEFK